MIKRVLKGRKISGIYCITYIPTGEIYIGRSTDIGSRWSEHTKSAYNIGSIAHSSLHTKMARDGIWNFQF
jgi:predicted GIY-YIG superfamily endonuclease